VHLVAAVVEPLDRCAVPGREVVGLRRAGCDSVALGLRERVEQSVALGFDRDPVLLAEPRNPML
jgi:hypothetical protein